MNPAVLADLIVALHLAIVLFVVAGQLAIVVGWVRGWKFVRNRWFRLVHLAVVAFVAGQALCGGVCPLTQWEKDLRWEAGTEGREGTFIGRLLHDVLFVEVPQGVLDASYVVFGGVVVACLFLVPPRWRRGDDTPGS